MKEKLAKLSELQRMSILWGIVSFVLIAGSSVGLFFNQPGWIIGVSIGCVVELLSMILLFEGTTEILKNEKPALFLLFYMLRMVLFVATILVLVLLQYKANLEVFNYSFWGALIGYTPMQAIVIITSLRTKIGKDKANG